MKLTATLIVLVISVLLVAETKRIGGGGSRRTSWGRPSSTSVSKPKSTSNGHSNVDNTRLSYGHNEPTARRPATPPKTNHNPSAPSDHAPSAPRQDTVNKDVGWNVGNSNPNAPNAQPGNIGWNVNNRNSPNQGAPPAYPGAPGGPGSHPGAPPPYPGGPGSHSGAPPPYPGGAPPPYSAHAGSPPGYNNGPPPPYPGYPGGNHYPAQGGNYPGGSYPGQGGYQAGGYHPGYQGGSNPGYGGGYGGYGQQQGFGNNYPGQYQGGLPGGGGFNSFGGGFGGGGYPGGYGGGYRSSGFSGTTALTSVVLGLTLWNLARDHNHYHTYAPNSQNVYRTPSGEVVNVSHDITPEKGTITEQIGNVSCVSVYNARAVSKWANNTLKDFHNSFPATAFPISVNGTNEGLNFTVTAGKIIHNETLFLTCCGTENGQVDLMKLTTGKIQDVNCIYKQYTMPFRKLKFVPINTTSSENGTTTAPMNGTTTDNSTMAAAPIGPTDNSTTPVSTGIPIISDGSTNVTVVPSNSTTEAIGTTPVDTTNATKTEETTPNNVEITTIPK